MGLSSLFPPVLVITARLRNLLAPWYSRWHAQHYESKRQGKRWQSETKAFRLLYRQVDPQRVLDCPVGTGRWFEEYQEHGASVLGIDLSKDMVADTTSRRSNIGKVPSDRDCAAPHIAICAESRSGNRTTRELRQTGRRKPARPRVEDCRQQRAIRQSAHA